MNRYKRIILFIMLCFIIFLYGGFLTLDWYVFSHHLFDVNHPEVPYSRISKVSATVLCCIIIWMIGKDGFQKKDTIILRIIALFIIFGDLLFLFDLEIPAVMCFGICQLLFIKRHSPGLKNYITAKRPGSHLFLDIVIIGVLSLASVIFFTFVFLPAQGISVLFFVILLYVIVLCVSLWMAWATPRLKFFPKPNAFLILIGLTCFFIGDITVGFGIALSGEHRVLVKYLTWILYVPGLVLPTLSGYDLKKIVRRSSPGKLH
jgi:hypothetical protein